MPRPELEPVDANALVNDVVRLFEAQFHAEGRPPIEPVLELSDGDVTVLADPLQLRRALSNLVLNAMDAMPEGGSSAPAHGPRRTITCASRSRTPARA